MGIRALRRRRRAASNPGRGPLDPATGAAISPALQPHVASLLDADEQRIIAEVRDYTMVSAERLVAIMDAVKYVIDRRINGSFVECGVWRGGSIMTMIKTLQHLGVSDRDVYLYDTFEGMTEPSAADTSPFEQPAHDTWQSTPQGERAWSWAFDPAIYGLELVRDVVLRTGYPADRVHFVQGPVEETLPGTTPTSVALLRLDTDWYESTLHELTHLYPLMPAGGVLIIDDFGHWDGARRAVTEYFSSSADPILLTRTDYTGRMGIKH